MTRKPDGTFAPGNPGGPGRPRRAIEEDYLRTLSDACPVDTWRDICRKAVEAACDGDPAARAWLTRYLVGDKTTLRQSLTQEEMFQLMTE